MGQPAGPELLARKGDVSVKGSKAVLFPGMATVPFPRRECVVLPSAGLSRWTIRGPI